jgi:hypothetical protein
VSFNVQKLSSGNLEFYFNVELKTIDGTHIGCFGNEFQTRDIVIEKVNTQIEIDLGTLALKKGEYLINVYFQVGKGAMSIGDYRRDYILLSVNTPIKKSQIWNTYINQPQHGYTPIIWSNIYSK